MLEDYVFDPKLPVVTGQQTNGRIQNPSLGRVGVEWEFPFTCITIQKSSTSRTPSSGIVFFQMSSWNQHKTKQGVSVNQHPDREVYIQVRRRADTPI